MVYRYRLPPQCQLRRRKTCEMIKTGTVSKSTQYHLLFTTSPCSNTIAFSKINKEIMTLPFEISCLFITKNLED
jgi:hypothetical protein